MEQEAPAERLPLGDRMKQYERAWESSLDKSLPWVARLDGHGFSKFTKGLQRPFDLRFTEAMLRTTLDLLVKFKPSAAYVQSDEITLTYFPKLDKNGEQQSLPYNGRVQKLVTLMSSYASVRFNWWMSKLVRQQMEEEEPISVRFDGRDMPLPSKHETLPEKVQERMLASIAHFDGRIFQLPRTAEVVNNVYWRLAKDCFRNAVSKAASNYYSPKQTHQKNTTEKLEMMKQKGVDFYTFHPAIKYGTIVKKEYWTKVTQEGQEVQRTRPVCFSTLMRNLGEPDVHAGYEKLLSAPVADEEQLKFLQSTWDAMDDPK